MQTIYNYISDFMAWCSETSEKLNTTQAKVCIFFTLIGIAWGAICYFAKGNRRR